jgi:hypothetical protein
MDLNTHNRYFKDIDYNVDASVSWVDRKLEIAPKSLFDDLVSVNYEERIVKMISSCHHVNSMTDLHIERGFN